MGILFSRIWIRLFALKEARILMVGLDAAGKTTILYKLKLNELVTTIPTIGFNVERVEYRNISFTVWDIGGQETIRPLWRYYYENIQGIIYVIDCNDKERLNDARHELEMILHEEQLSEAPLLVLANKQDLPHAATTGELTEKLGLHKQPRRKWSVQGSCALNGDGIYEGLDWLSRALTVKSK